MTYEGYPHDIHWMEYKDIKLERVFVEWCLKNNKYSWIDHQAKKIHQDLIDQDTIKRKSDQDKKAKEKATRQANNKERLSQKRVRQESSEEKALARIQKRTR